MAIEFKSSQRFASLGNLRRMACASGLIHIPKDLEPYQSEIVLCPPSACFFWGNAKRCRCWEISEIPWMVAKSEKLPWMVQSLQTFNGIHHLSIDAGFLPSTVWFCSHLSNSHPRLQKCQKVPAAPDSSWFTCLTDLAYPLVNVNKKLWKINMFNG